MDNKKIDIIFKDLQDIDLPKDSNSWNKLKCNIENGDRIYWYYQEDIDFAEEMEFNIREDKAYSGIVVIIPDIEYNGGDLDCDNTIVIVDRYPCEKCYPITDWIALNRLLDEENLIEIYKQ